MQDLAIDANRAQPPSVNLLNTPSFAASQPWAFRNESAVLEEERLDAERLQASAQEALDLDEEDS
jgi:hypothetical protein